MALPQRVNVVVEKPKDIVLPSPTRLPPGPGNNWGDAAFSKDHCRRQHLEQEFAGKAPAVYKPTYIRPKEARPEIKSASAEHLRIAVEATQQGRVDELIAPPAMTLDDKILRYDAYFVEPVPESGVETERVRAVTIICFPVDDTVLVQEPKIPNSGLQGGTLLKRQRVSLDKRDAVKRAPPPSNGSRFPDLTSVAEEFVSVNDINVGGSTWLHGREFHVVDCDNATRALLTGLGRTVAAGGPIPADAYARYLAARDQEAERLDNKAWESRDMAITMESLSTGGGKSSGARYPDELARVQRFLRDSGKMLRFYAYWADPEAAPGSLRTFDVRYFVEDDTISLVEHQHDGVDQPKNFLSRRRLPKDASHAKAVELTFAGRINGMREVYLGKGDKYYSSADLGIGRTVNVYGRDFFVYDADAATRETYFQEYGIRLAAAVPLPDNTQQPRRRLTAAPVPPPTGFGSEEDSLSSCRGLVLRAPKKRAPHHELEGKSLRFELRLHKPERQEDLMRRFLLTYHLDDDELMIAEVPLRNTGYTGGRFLRKQRLRKTEGNARECFLNLEDIHVGAVIDVTGFHFEVIDADQRSLNYIEHKETFGRKPEDLTRVTVERLQELLSAFQAFVSCRFCTNTEAFRAMDTDHDGKITVDELREVLRGNQITTKEEEVVGIMKQLDATGRGSIDYSDFFSAMQSPLKVRLDGTAAESKTIDVVEGGTTAAAKAEGSRQHVLRDRVVKMVKERFEGRCLNGFEMFRMISTQPRSFRGKRADMASLYNGAKDTVFTPVQLRRTVGEHLGLMLNDEEMGALLHFFFPALPAEEFKSQLDASTVHSVDLPTFQSKLVEMSQVRQLK